MPGDKIGEGEFNPEKRRIDTLVGSVERLLQAQKDLDLSRKFLKEAKESLNELMWRVEISKLKKIDPAEEEFLSEYIVVAKSAGRQNYAQDYAQAVTASSEADAKKILYQQFYNILNSQGTSHLDPEVDVFVLVRDNAGELKLSSKVDPVRIYQSNVWRSRTEEELRLEQENRNYNLYGPWAD